MAVMGSNFGNLFLVSLDTPVGSDIISVDEALLCLVGLAVGKTCGECADNHFPGDIHIYQLVISQIYLIPQPTQRSVAPPRPCSTHRSFHIRLLIIKNIYG